MMQTYSCIPMARIHRSLGALGEEERDKIEASLGPNLCLLLERVRASDKDAAAASQEEEEEKGSAPAGEEEGLCATLVYREPGPLPVARDDRWDASQHDSSAKARHW